MTNPFLFLTAEESGSSGSGLPTPPTRDQIINGRCVFQGVHVVTQQYGPINCFGPELDMLDVFEDRVAWYRAFRAAGATVCMFGLAGDTYVSGGFRFPVPGPEMRWIDDRAGLADRLAEIVTVGGFDAVLLMLPGDGRTENGNRYGQQFLRTNIDRIIDGLKTSKHGDLTKFVIFCPGYDGVVWVWTEEQIYEFGRHFRSLVPDGYLAIENPAGIVGPSGEGDGQYTDSGKLDNYDIIAQEFPITATDNPAQITQISARMLGPAYKRPAWQNPEEDQDAPFPATSSKFLLRKGTPRGPYGPWALEFGTYRWTRGCSLQEVEDYRAILVAVGWPSVG